MRRGVELLAEDEVVVPRRGEDESAELLSVDRAVGEEDFEALEGPDDAAVAPGALWQSVEVELKKA